MQLKSFDDWYFPLDLFLKDKSWLLSAYINSINTIGVGTNIAYGDLSLLLHIPSEELSY